MNYSTNSTVIMGGDFSDISLKEALIPIGVILLLCYIYYCLFTPSKRESDKKMKWSVDRAKVRIALRHDLACKV